MYFKRIEVQGFKSFAEKINMDFDSGITCIVGPNGSGKSNISDCIRWVLGEQSIKSLRGSKMEDVIFVGTQYRRPMGFAEVSITIDNSDQRLPVEYLEVVVTRRVYRSGESEFFINKVPCRMKDVHELFMDTGIGRDGYSVIGQGRVDEILSSKSEDRRAIFEEASGIMKFKTRKNEAQRKLELTTQNLIRINDIIDGLEVQLEPLQKQSVVAKKYLILRDELKEIEVAVYVEKIKKAKEMMASVNETCTIAHNDIVSEELNLKNINSVYQSKLIEVKEISKKLDEAKNIFYSSKNNLGKYSYEIKLNEEKINNLNLNIFRLKNEIKDLDNSVKHSQNEEKNKQEKLQVFLEKEKKYKDELLEKENKLRKITENLTLEQRKIENLNENFLEKLDLQAVKKSQVSNMLNLLQNIDVNKQNIEIEIEGLTGEVRKTTQQLEVIENKIRHEEKTIINLKNKIKNFEIEKNKLIKEKDEKNKQINEIRTDINVGSSKYKMLNELEKNFEGYARSVKIILKACQLDKNFGKGVHGALVQLLTVPKRMEIAIEVALGNALQNIVTETEEDAKKIIEYLKENKVGRATFLPITAVKGRSFETKLLEEVRNCEGFVGVASELISYNDKYREIVLSFLGRVVVVENIANGINMAKKFGYGFKIVTLEGEFLNVGGSITGGSVSIKETGILSRTREIDELNEKIKYLEKCESKVKEELGEISCILEEKMILEESLNKELKENEITLLHDKNYRERIDDEYTRHKKRLDNVLKEKEELILKETETKSEYDKNKILLAELEEEIAQIKDSVNNNKEKHKTASIEKEKLQSQVIQNKININSVLESIENLKDFINTENVKRNDMLILLKNKKDEQERYLLEITNFEKIIESLKNELKTENLKKDELNNDIAEIEKQKEDEEVAVNEILQKIQDINRNLILLKENFSKIEVRKNKVDSEIVFLKNKLWEDYELTFSNANEIKKNIENISLSQKRINEIKSEIKSLGNVNIGAVEEYKKVKEHYDFMKNQKDDMQNSKENLKKVIAEVTNVMKKQFTEQFELINKNFKMVFAELFDGGKAELILEDKENVLESGIEIRVQPPGKKLQNMMLLSGGERAFTAIALLFAIIKLRPAPFCILDEIEAALDDANVYKFAEYIKKHVDLSQFILITHRKGTMEAADTIYGVTMQEQGISKIVSLKLEQVPTK